jgi:hypothetical protein
MRVFRGKANNFRDIQTVPRRVPTLIVAFAQVSAKFRISTRLFRGPSRQKYQNLLRYLHWNTSQMNKFEVTIWPLHSYAED